MSTEVKNKLTLSVPEAAELLGVAKNSLYCSIKKGEFKHVIRIGKRILIPRAALEKKLAGTNVD